MKRVLRSVIDFGDIGAEQIRDNYFILAESNLDFSSESDEAIHKFVQDFYLEHNASPTYQTTVDFFESDNEIAVIERLKEVKDAPGYTATQFKNLCNKLYDKQRENRLDIVLKETARIKSQGVKFGKETKKGVRSAVAHFLSNADELLRTPGGERTSGDIFEEGEDVISEYEHGVANPQLGRLTGLEKIDEVCKGLRPGEMMLCLGYVGHCKTTFALNYAYNTAIYYGWNVMYFSLEMMRPQVRRILYTMHSSHPKFAEHPARANGGFGLDYRKVRDFEMNEVERDLYNLVVKDLNEVREWKRPDGFVHKYGKLLIERPTTEITVPEIKLKAELENSRNELGLLIIDHAGLVENKTGRSVDNYSVGANYVIKDVSQLATSFNDGQGIPVLMPFQANRSGWREAMKNDGHYKLDALSYANEAEKSASVIMYVYLDDDLREKGELKLGCLKNRDNPHFQQFNARIQWNPRRLTGLLDGDHTDELITDLDL